MDEIIYRVRKDGSLKVATKAEAVAICRAAARKGYQFGQSQQFGGFLVEDMDA